MSQPKGKAPAHIKPKSFNHPGQTAPLFFSIYEYRKSTSDEKFNEITAFPKLVERYELEANGTK